MLSNKIYDFLLNNLSFLNVKDMQDGQMGSIKFIYDNNTQKRMFSKQIEEIEFTDKDNIPILVTINIDQFGDLYEVDIWKVDFSQVINYPSC
ncbi:DUF6984 family protein [Rhizosphaericola mali]|uniref:DUF6984 domain-containing protein n=1 Tax=Rhizosphaericola mali TaxID=2545455 RepID=A0A5P2G363_9BACT|nr:hypothetical protein [Rhizosphaericola mali]QES88569.1 hypothetical protein E0W69_007810 [Rhizosphaericola mali]